MQWCGQSFSLQRPQFNPRVLGQLQWKQNDVESVYSVSRAVQTEEMEEQEKEARIEAMKLEAMV